MLDVLRVTKTIYATWHYFSGLYITVVDFIWQDKRGLALDGKLKHEDTNLASSTM